MAHWAKDVRKDRETSLQSELDSIVAARRERRLAIFKIVRVVLILAILGLAVNVVRSITLPPTGGLIVGEEARVSMSILAAVDEESWAELRELQAEGDQVGQNLLERSGRVFVLGEGTTVLVLESEFGSALVRAQGGRNAGKAGWVLPGRLVPIAAIRGPAQ